ncbi:hypothetical protein ACFORL_00335 [Legionella dresdenensis]|uniref:Uncharacterized protein n=1 Tax=Legionella dresdenensis TaxID=450200 RepID=A0ABV8CB47_9GAMM
MLKAARVGNTSLMDTYAFRAKEKFTRELLGKVFLEAAQHNQILLMKHIFYRISGTEYPAFSADKKYLYDALYECFKRDNFELLDLYVDYQIILIECTKRMLDENLELAKIKQLANGFFKQTKGMGFCEELADLCNERKRFEVRRTITNECTIVQDGLQSSMKP